MRSEPGRGATTVRTLRARLYATLIELARAYARRHRGVRSAFDIVVMDFQRLVAEQASRRHHDARTRATCVSPSHLRCAPPPRHVGKEVILGAIELAARRQLLFSDESAERVALFAGFRDPSYLRASSGAARASPRRFRDAARHHPRAGETR
jgi:hypothetical protein